MSKINKQYHKLRKFAKQFRVLRKFYHLIKPPVDIPVINKTKVDKLIRKSAFTGKVGVSMEEEKIIISLTSFPPRMSEIHYTIYSLLNQSLPVTAVILWLSEDEFPHKEKDLPHALVNLKRYGLTIQWVSGNIRSYKKIIPALISYPDAVIITADDDLYYPSDWVEKLYKVHKLYPKDVIAHRVHWISYTKDGLLAGYNDWPKCIGGGSCRFANFFTEGGGVLYPPKSLYKDVTRKDRFMKLAPKADDIWMWAMAVQNETKIRIPYDAIRNITYNSREMQIGPDRLGVENVEQRANDRQLRAVLDAYPDIEKKLKEEHSYNVIV